MATIAVAPIILNAALLQIAVDNYEKHVSGVVLTPSPTGQRWKGIDGSVVAVAGVTEWTMQITYAQDWTTANSLAQYLATNAGQSKTIILSPLGATAGKPKITVDAIIVAGPIGGEVGALQTASVTLQCTGQPVRSTW